MKNFNFRIVENKKWILIEIILLIFFASILIVWIFVFPRDGQRMVVYIGGIVVWSIAVLMGVLGIFETWFKFFSLKDEKLMYCNGYFKKKTINMRDVAKIIIIDRGTMKPYNTHNLIAYKVKFIDKDNKVLLWFYDVTGSYVVFNQKFKEALSYYQITIENKTIS